MTRAGRALQVAAVILTGMGRDGAAGMARLRQGGAWTAAQDQASCVVDGMPSAAEAAGGVRYRAPIEQLALDLAAWVRRP